MELVANHGKPCFAERLEPLRFEYITIVSDGEHAHMTIPWLGSDVVLWPGDVLVVDDAPDDGNRWLIDSATVAAPLEDWHVIAHRLRA